ncbi:ATP-grasp domain-containing protein [Streptomyces sp. NPDC057743]|uniref:preATP grasp domain-containing protein n=1 Tax=Streptomyces sp. NPDC057743 TaxID=3346236 RepID=UPI0036C09ECF
MTDTTGSTYTAQLKAALTGRPDAPFVWLCNFEVEERWAQGYPGLPAARVAGAAPTVQRMEELGALLADPSDHLLLDQHLAPAFRAYADRIGLGAPAELVTPAPAGPGGTSQAVLDSPELLARLGKIAADGGYLMPMGTSAAEQKIAEATGLRLAVPAADTFERVNSKIYSRRLVDELGLRAVPGFCCETTGELRRALTEGIADGPLIVKDAYGVSGKGLVVLDGPAKAERLLRMADRRARRTGDDALHVVVERFLPKEADLNYQFTIDRTGQVRFDFVKQALTEGGVHLGHLMPADLTEGQRHQLRDAAERIGARLFHDGFFGVVGVDALLGADGLLYPVLEINARLNMSSYQGRITERFAGPKSHALARHYPLRLRREVSFEEVTSALGPLAAPPTGGTGAVLTCFGTVNAQAGTASPFPGRLYALLVAPGRAELHALDRRITEALRPLDTAGSTP